MKKISLYLAVTIIAGFLSGCASVSIKDSEIPSVNQGNYCVLAFDYPLLKIKVNGVKLGNSTQTFFGFAPDGKMFVYPPGKYTIEMELHTHYVTSRTYTSTAYSGGKFTVSESGSGYVYTFTLDVDLEHGQHYFVYNYFENREPFIRLVNETDPASVWGSRSWAAEHRREYADKAIRKLKSAQ